MGSIEIYIDDQHRNPNMNNKDHLVGRLPHPQKKISASCCQLNYYLSLYKVFRRWQNYFLKKMYPPLPQRILKESLWRRRKITNKCHCGPFWVINDHLWSFWIIIDLFGPFWALWGNFGPFFHNRSGAYKNEQKLKHDLDYQMSTKMVQENHEDNFNTQWYKYKILVYFGTIYMEHPVERVSYQIPSKAPQLMRRPNMCDMVDTQTLPATMPSFSYITCIKCNWLLLLGGASQEREA